MNYTFTLMLQGPNPNDQSNLDWLYEAGCDDAIFGERDGVYIADFDREASSFSGALIEAIAAVEGAISGLKVIRVEPEQLVTASEIAARTHRTRESIRQLFEGSRGSGDFPRPTAWISDRTRLWDWSEVSSWFAGEVHKNTDEMERADLLGLTNALLTLRRFMIRHERTLHSSSNAEEGWRKLCEYILGSGNTSKACIVGRIDEVDKTRETQ